jgi:hypothetical protein
MTTIKLPAVSKRELLDAIRAGVADAMWRMMTDATDAPCADFYDMIKKGVEKGFSNALPDQQEIEKAIEKGVFDAMPFSDLIMSAVTAGVKEAIK